MTEKIRLAIVGCGGMGLRHLYALGELERTGLSTFELVGACDPNEENARSLAAQAEELLGQAPQVAADLEELEGLGAIRAVDVCALPNVHHTVSVEAMQRGWDVMCEKPMGLTVRACNCMRKTVAETGRVLSVAENYRRDPMNRLARALLEAGAVGDPRLMLHQTMGGGDQMLISVWRHQKNASGLLLDVGVHFADIMEFFLGEAETVYAQTRLHETIRKNPMAAAREEGISSSGVYARWQRQLPAEFEATAEDAGYGTVLFRSGAVCQYVEDHAARGKGLWQRAIYGSRGSMDLPGDRSGRRLALHRESEESIDDERLLALVPEFHLDEGTAALFGGDRMCEYDLEFPAIDRKVIAIEYWEFGGAIREGFRPEVDVEQGARSVALSYALMESQVAGRAVTVDEVLEERVGVYQEEINAELGL